MTETADKEEIRDFAALACAIVKAADGKPIVSVTRHYPTGWDAVWHGFKLTIGAAMAVGALAWVSRSVRWVMEYFA